MNTNNLSILPVSSGLISIPDSEEKNKKGKLKKHLTTAFSRPRTLGVLFLLFRGRVGLCMALGKQQIKLKRRMIMSVPIEKLGAACFLENTNLFGNRQAQPEKYNLYTGLRAMSETIESLTQAVHKIEKQLNSINHKLENLP